MKLFIAFLIPWVTSLVCMAIAIRRGRDTFIYALVSSGFALLATVAAVVAVDNGKAIVSSAVAFCAAYTAASTLIKKKPPFPFISVGVYIPAMLASLYFFFTA